MLTGEARVDHAASRLRVPGDVGPAGKQSVSDVILYRGTGVEVDGMTGDEASQLILHTMCAWHGSLSACLVTGL